MSRRTRMETQAVCPGVIIHGMTRPSRLSHGYFIYNAWKGLLMMVKPYFIMIKSYKYMQAVVVYREAEKFLVTHSTIGKPSQNFKQWFLRWLDVDNKLIWDTDWNIGREVTGMGWIMFTQNSCVKVLMPVLQCDWFGDSVLKEVLNYNEVISMGHNPTWWGSL